jgi:hypothetical protein
MPDEIARIAAGLSEAQRRAITTARPDAPGEIIHWFANGTARSIPLELKARTPFGVILTPLGLRVRAHIMGEG